MTAEANTNRAIVLVRMLALLPCFSFVFFLFLLFLFLALLAFLFAEASAPRVGDGGGGDSLDEVLKASDASEAVFFFAGLASAMRAGERGTCSGRASSLTPSVDCGIFEASPFAPGRRRCLSSHCSLVEAPTIPSRSLILSPCVLSSSSIHLNLLSSP